MTLHILPDVAPSSPDALLRLPAVREMVGLSRSEIYRRIESGRFPRPVRLGDNAVAWRLSDLQRWISELPEHGSRRR